jgi:uncharacterized protein YdeI (YjbR/CyaY-like superfamily)
MPAYLPKIDEYISKAAPFAQPILNHLRALVHEVCPTVEEAWKWSFPNFVYGDGILCSMAAFKAHCAFMFWKAALLDDPDGVLATGERTSMGNLGKITSLHDLPPDAVLRAYLQGAMNLNEQAIKVPKKLIAPDAKLVTIPEDFIGELQKNATAMQHFEAFSYSHKKEYVEWITGAKTQETRMRRIAKAVEQVAQGKSQNYKYERNNGA